ncbi:MAG TPA: kelch repeat-containing protein, partial [Thermodesulfobacteriota bacterium]|nr:kelch repeat-containing protein [Thermodesulfobacteriota bacterium]
MKSPQKYYACTDPKIDINFWVAKSSIAILRIEKDVPVPQSRPPSKVLYAVLSIFLIILSLPLNAFASQTRALFGPEVFTRTSGSTDIYTRSFTIPGYVSAPYNLHIKNGNPASNTNKVAVDDAVSSASAWLNGVKVVAENEFSKTVDSIDKTVTLNQTNTLEIRLNSAPGSYITLTISGAINLGSLNQPRSGHTANLLSDGRVLITGGNSPAGILSSAEIFEPSTLSFSLLQNSLTTPRTEHTATLLPDSDTMLIAGKDPLGALFTAELFDLAAGTFTQINNPLKNLRSGHTSTLLPDGKVLIIGGIDASDILLQGTEVFDPKTAVIFDPKTGAFNTLSNNLSIPRANHTATLLPDGKVLIIGGKNDSGVLSSAEIFDQASQSFTSLPASLSKPRYGHTATLLPDGSVLILGGSDGASILSSAEIYDPHTSAFTLSSSSLNTSRFNHTATLLPYGEVLTTGGEDQTGILSTAELFGPPAQDATAPTVLTVDPASGARDINPNTIISVSFSEPIDARTLSQSSFTLTGPEGAVNGTVSVGESGLLAFFAPATALSCGT